MKFQVYRNQRSGWRWVWRLLASNNRVVARSAGQFNSASDARKAVQRIVLFIGEALNDEVFVETKLAPQIEAGNVIRPERKPA